MIFIWYKQVLAFPEMKLHYHLSLIKDGRVLGMSIQIDPGEHTRDDAARMIRKKHRLLWALMSIPHPERKEL
jgi:hypothetical protein